MVVTLPVVNFLGGKSRNFFLLAEGTRTTILQDACSKIENKLADMRYLREFSWMGQQAFYNDMPGGHKEKGPDPAYRYKGGVFADHMKDQFYISLDATAENFLISNAKEVHSSKKSFNLFELIWYKFGPYSVPKKLHATSIEQVLWYKRTKAMEKKMYRELDTSTDYKMNFYNRYFGRRYYQMTERRGMDSSLHDKFKLYIHTAFSRGLDDAIEEGLEINEMLFMGDED